MERRCHYEVLGLDRGCSAEEIKSAYRRLALQRHPDKLIPTGVSQADANAQFQELGHAYEVLSDPKERAWYDSHRSQILFADPTAANAVPDSVIPNLFSFFSTAVFSGYASTGKGFYKVYADVFNKIYSNELSFARKLGLGIDAVREAPAMGDLKSDYAQVTAFYGYWLGFCTVMDFCWADQYDVMAGPNRKARRLMEEENKKQRRKARREYNESVRGLAEFVKKRDKRVMDMMVKREEERERRKKEAAEKKRREEREKLERAMAYEEPEWAKAAEEEGEEEGEEEERRRNELYCVMCGKKFKSEKQWKNHEQSKKHKEKVAEFRESIADEEEVEVEDVDELSERMREGLEIRDEEGVSGGEDEFYDFGDENQMDEEDDESVDELELLKAMAARQKSREELDDDDEDEMELLKAMAARQKSREELDDDDEDEMELLKAMAVRQKSREELDDDEDEMELLKAMAARQKSREELDDDDEDDGDDEDEMGLLKAMAARQKSRENVVDTVRVDDGDSESEDEMDVLEAMVAGRKSRNNATFRGEVEDVENDSNGAYSVPMEYENRKPVRRKGKSRKSDGEAKRVDMNEISSVQSEAASDNDDDLDVKESVSDSVVENASTNNKHDDRLPRKKKSSKQAVEKKKENVKKEANVKSKSSARGKKYKATSKNSSNACDTCGEEFGSRNQLHKHLGDTGHASLKR